MHHRSPQSGVTLIEMLVVVAIISLMVAITMPSLTSGLDSLRINGAASDTVAFLNRALTRASREQRVIEVSVRMPERTMVVQSTGPGVIDQLTMPQGVRIAGVYPALPNSEAMPAVRQFLLLPGGTVPRIGVELTNERGMKRLVQVDPITGVPQILKGTTAQPVEQNAMHGPESVTVGGGDMGMHSATGDSPK